MSRERCVWEQRVIYEKCAKMQIENINTQNDERNDVSETWSRDTPAVRNLFHDEIIFDMQFPLSLLSRTYDRQPRTRVCARARSLFRFMSKWRINRTKNDLHNTQHSVCARDHGWEFFISISWKLSRITFSILFGLESDTVWHMQNKKKQLTTKISFCCVLSLEAFMIKLVISFWERVSLTDNNISLKISLEGFQLYIARGENTTALQA